MRKLFVPAPDQRANNRRRAVRGDCDNQSSKGRHNCEFPRDATTRRDKLAGRKVAGGLIVMPGGLYAGTNGRITDGFPVIEGDILGTRLCVRQYR